MNPTESAGILAPCAKGRFGERVCTFRQKNIELKFEGADSHNRIEKFLSARTTEGVSIVEIQYVISLEIAGGEESKISEIAQRYGVSPKPLGELSDGEQVHAKDRKEKSPP